MMNGYRIRCRIRYRIRYMNDACLCKLQLQYRICISYTISYVRYRIRYRIYCIRYRMLNVRYRMSDVRYRIRHLQKLRYRRCLVQVLAIFVYDVVYDIVRNIVCQMYDIVRRTYDIVYDICKNYDIVGFWYRFLPLLYTTSYTISYVIS